jgi:hypothetical protein
VTFAELRRQLTGARPFLRTLRSLFRTQGDIVRRMILHDQPIDLSAWSQPMADAAAAQLGPVANQAFRRLLRDYLRRGGRLSQLRNLIPMPANPFALDVPEVREFVQRMGVHFAVEVNGTSVRHASEARRYFRNELAGGLERGEAQARLTQRLDKIFKNPVRTEMIAHNEGSRGIHGGQFLAMQRVDEPMAKFLIASDDACEICLGVAARGPIPMDEPFYVFPKGGPYSTPLFAPIHVRCMCSVGYSVV